MEDVRRVVRSLMADNRADLREAAYYFARKKGALTRWRNYWEQEYLRRRGEPREEARRRLEEYERDLAAEDRAWRDLQGLVERAYLARGLSEVEVLSVAIEAKREEERVLDDLHNSLRVFLPWREAWIRRVEDLWSRVSVRRKALEDLWPTGTVFGQVRERGGGPLEGAVVEVAETGRRGVSDREGMYRIEEVPSGRRLLTCTLEGYEPASREVEVPTGRREVRVDWELVPVVVKRIYRVHKGWMFYRRRKRRKTPSPFAWLSVYVYTQDPDQYPEELMDSALEHLRDGVFTSLGAAVFGTPKRPEPGAEMREEVRGWEYEEVDPDEVEHRLEDGSPELDMLRYICVFYRSNGAAKVYKVYWGRLELVGEMWHHVEEGVMTGGAWEEEKKKKKEERRAPLWEEWMPEELKEIIP